MLYGISDLKNSTDHLSGGKTKVLVALGGYPEDSPQFSRLGRDPVAMDTLVVDIVTMMVDLRLDGIAIHWVVPTGACQPFDVQSTLSALFANVRKLLNLNNLSALMTLILPYGDAVTVDSMPPDLVDFFFFMTHEFLPDKANTGVCEYVTTEALTFLTSIPGYNKHQRKLCVGISMAAIRFGLQIDRYLTSTRFPYIPGRAPLFEMCTGQLPQESNYKGCAFYVDPTPQSNIEVIYAYPSKDKINDLLHLHFPNRSSRCTLVADLDFETYKPGCSKSYPTLTRLYQEV